MPVRLRSIHKLAKEQSTTADVMVGILAARGIAVVGDLYDAALYEAVGTATDAPTSSKVNRWGLSHRLGLGAVKFLLDPLSIHITVHDCRGSQYLMLRKKGRLSYVKWHYANYAAVRTSTCKFQVRGFVYDAKYDYYLFTCFDGPFAWVIPRKQLLSTWNALLKGKEVNDFGIIKGQEENEGGALQIRLHTETSKFALTDSKQLGL